MHFRNPFVLPFCKNCAHRIIFRILTAWDVYFPSPIWRSYHNIIILIGIPRRIIFISCNPSRNRRPPHGLMLQSWPSPCDPCRSNIWFTRWQNGVVLIISNPFYSVMFGYNITVDHFTAWIFLMFYCFVEQYISIPICHSFWNQMFDAIEIISVRRNDSPAFFVLKGDKRRLFFIQHCFPLG